MGFFSELGEDHRPGSDPVLQFDARLDPLQTALKRKRQIVPTFKCPLRSGNLGLCLRERDYLQAA